MRPRTALTLAATLALALAATPGRAQLPTAGEPDPLRPYASRSTTAFEAERSTRAYSRARPLPPPTRSYPAATVRGVRDYYPTMRRGQNPNKNVVDPRTLCVPGRRAMILRGR